MVKINRVSAWTGTLKNHTKCVWRWEPNRMSNYFFLSPPAHLCAVTCMTEKSENTIQKGLKKRIPNHNLHVQFDRKISVSESNTICTLVRARGLSRECVLRIPSVSLKATHWGGVSESAYKKVGPVLVLGRAR